MYLEDNVAQTEIDAFLNERRHAILATNQPGRPPQLSPVWYVWKDGSMYISTSEQSLKARNIRRDSQISVCVDGGWGDFRYVALSGQAAIVEHGAELQQNMRWQIIRKYHDSEESARAYYDSTADENAILLILKPSRVVYKDFNN